jgi:hypothetical protein
MRRYQRDTAIATKGAGLWADLCTTVRESAEGFNQYYGQDRPVSCELVNNRLRLTKEHVPPDPGPPQPPMKATMEFSLYSKGVQIVRTMPRPGLTPNPAVKKWEFYFDADNDGELFFTDDRNRRLSTDALAQEVLEEWMFAK